MKQSTKDRYTFWIENRLDSEVTYTIEQLKAKFVKYLRTKENAWIEHYGSVQIVAAFIGEKTGLNAVTEEHEEIRQALKPTLLEYLK